LNLDPTQLPPETRILPLARAAGWDAGSVLKLTQALIEQDSIGHEDVWELYEADTIGEILQLIERRYPAPAGAIPDEEDGFHDEKRERADGQAD
jgi:pheromone shutdown protein TraB